MKATLYWVLACCAVVACSENGPSAGLDAGQDQSISQDGPVVTEAGAADQFVLPDFDPTSRQGMVPGPDEPGFDQDLAKLAEQYERQYHVFITPSTGLNCNVVIDFGKSTERAHIETFLRDTDGWDFEQHAGMSVIDTGMAWHKVAGAYAGPGAAADAWRYGLLRDFGGSTEDVDRARAFLIKSLEGLHRAVEITGVKGVIARGFIRKDHAPGWVPETVDLADENGHPLPPEKNNGTWREDGSGNYPNYIWEDSCSRDMYIGWVIGFAGVWEVIRDDDTIPADLKAKLKADALDLADALAQKRMQENGKEYDLLIPDADGRLTYHAYLNENWLDRVFVGLPRNGFHAIMALGCAAGLAYVAEDPQIDAFLYDELIGQRNLPKIAKDYVAWIYTGTFSNYSNYNMAFEGAYLALRYLHPKAQQARRDVQEALEKGMYNIPDEKRQPVEMGQTFFDFTFAAGMASGSVWAPPDRSVDQAVLDRGLQTLKAFPDPPYWSTSVINCDDQEIASGSCTAVDGTHLDVLDSLGWNDAVICEQVVPMKIRPPSNYHWRSNPYQPNSKGEDPGHGMEPGVDFRFAYWLGRWIRR
jgi:hypothetical protein